MIKQNKQTTTGLLAINQDSEALAPAIGRASPTCYLDGVTLERVRYFPRQMLAADDMTAEQNYSREKMRRHNRMLHGWGVVCGCDVKPAADATHPWRVAVCPGFLLTPQGDEVAITRPVYFDVATGAPDGEQTCRPAPCPPTPALGLGSDRKPAVVHLAVRYAECPSRPVRVNAVGCACDDSACEHSRIRDDFELKLMWDLPRSHTEATKWDDDWEAKKEAWVNGKNKGFVAPDCPGCTDEPWVVLASILLPAAKTDEITTIGYADRRVLYSMRALQRLLFPSQGT